MSNSSLICYTKISPNSNNPRNHKIDKITIHHMAGNLSIEACGAGFADPDRQGSSNYGIGSDGRIGMYVEEKNRSWCSSSRENDHRAVTIEVANDSRDPDWHVSDKALASLIDLCVDICQRNGIEKLNFTGDASGNLTQHNYFAATACPGPYLKSKFPYIADEVNKRLKASPAAPQKPQEAAKPSGVSTTLYRVQVGAYSNRANADKALAKLKEAGFTDAFIAVVDGKLFRVQVGAFSKKENAEAQLSKVKAAGFSGFVTKNGGNVDTGGIGVGSSVKVKKGAKDYSGNTLADFVYTRTHKVKSISGNRVVITYNGAVTAAVHLDNLTLA